MDYSERRLTTVQINYMDREYDEDGMSVNFGLELRYSNMRGQPDGPSVGVSLSVMFENENPTFEDAERRALDAAAAFLKRAAQETPEHLYEVFHAGRLAQFAQPPSDHSRD